MAIRLEDSFEVEAPVAQVWDYFQDINAIAQCLPSTKLLNVLDESTFEGEVQVQLGPVKAKFGGTASIEEVDRDNWSMTLSARGNQFGATGRADARVQLNLKQVTANHTKVNVVGDVSIFGPLAHMGGGMIQTIAKKLFGIFAKCAAGAIAERV